MANKASQKIKMRSNGQSIAINKAAKFHYDILEELEAGIVLKGAEVKSLRMYNANIMDAYAFFKNGEMFVKNLDIPSVQFATQKKFNPRDERKLLLHKRELKKFVGKLTKGLTIIPMSIYFTKRGFVKLKLGLAKGKKLFDKKRELKERDMKREVARDIKISKY
jgi:SsrA-binding protein